jgi:SAM-dependent methyltransferase
MTRPGDAAEAARLQEFYQHGAEFRKLGETLDNPTYAQYLDLYRHHVPQGGRVLDIGCGIGQTTNLLRKSGYRPVGAELSHRFLKEGKAIFPLNLATAASGHALPFAKQTFDAVGACAVIEHIPRIHLLFPEIVRVLKPGGHVILFGPNMISPIHAVKLLLCAVAGKHPSLHPLGSPAHLVASISLSAWKLSGLDTPYVYRRPNLDEANRLHTDADAIYLANVMDLKKYFRGKGFSILSLATSNSRGGRVFCRLVPYLSGGIGFVARNDN